MTNENRSSINFISKKWLKWAFILIVVLIFISAYIPVPYFITSPGSAMELSSLVNVNQGYKESGKLMLTTVSLAPATIPTYLYSKINSYMETIPEIYILNQNESDSDYTKRQIQVMKESQQNAIIAAFHYLKLPITIHNKGVRVMGLIAGLPAEKVLKTGDVIESVDKQPISNLDDLLTFLKGMKAGDVVQIRFQRDNEVMTKEVSLVNLEEKMNGEQNTKKKIGLGFYPYQEREVSPSREVSFHTERIGGPSAGLMFTLEIINQLTPNDLTHGYKIAGTGTITADGVIGQIGGARLKVKAAYEKGAEIFFIPKDIASDDTNQKDAIKSDKDLGNPLKIVPVTNLSEAVQYLMNLEDKKSSKES